MKISDKIQVISLFLGMYFITCLLFYIESGSIAKGALFGLISASLKTIWAQIHKGLFNSKKNVARGHTFCLNCQEILPIN